MNGPGTVNNRTQVQVPLDQNETIYLDTVKPDVFNVAVAVLKTSTSVEVEKFLGGTPNQTLKVRVVGAVTLKHNAGGMGSILTNTGADKILFTERIYGFTYVSDRWYEQDDSATGGGGGTTNFPITANDSNSGVASPALFDGSVGVTISANTVGAVSLGGTYNNPTWIVGLAWSKITGTPTTIAGYGITDFNSLGDARWVQLANFVALGDAEWVQLDGTYNNPSWLNQLAWTKITGTPTTIAGYGITDYNSLGDARWVQLTNFVSLGNAEWVQLDGSYTDPTWIVSLAWSKISSTPTTIAGYGITDYNSLGDARWVQLTNFVSLGDAEWVQLDGSYNDPSWITGLAWSKITGAPSFGFGDVVGPASATDNALARYDATTGKLVQNSTAILEDTGVLKLAAGILVGTGTSTQNDVQDSNFASETLYIDAPNSRVGIGTDTPEATLSIHSQGTGNVRGVSGRHWDNTTAFSHFKYIGGRARGSVGSPSAVLNQDSLVGFIARGYKTTDWSNTVGGLYIFAEANWTDTSTPTSIRLRGIASGTTVAEWFKFTSLGITRNIASDWEFEQTTANNFVFSTNAVDRLIIGSTISVPSLAGTGTRLVNATAAGVLGTNAIGAAISIPLYMIQDLSGNIQDLPGTIESLGGLVVDAEARNAILEIINRLQASGIIA